MAAAAAAAAASSTRAATGLTSSGKTAPEMEYAGRGGGSPLPPVNMFRADFSLRLLLFATCLTALIVMATSKQTVEIPVDPTTPSFTVALTARFQDSTDLISLVAALAVTCFYGGVTMLTSAAAVIRNSSPSTKLLFHLVLLDMLMAGVLAAATGAGFAIGYIGLKGNSHVQWDKIGDIYDKFSNHTIITLSLSLVASIVLVTLVILSSYALYRRSR